MSIAVLDIGKTNAKVALVSEAGEEIETRRRPNAVQPAPPYGHFDTEGLWAFVTDALRDLAMDVRQIVPVTHGACAALVDETGDLVLPVLDYEDPGPDRARSGYAPPPLAETGSPPLAGGLNVGAQLHWLEKAFPEAFGRARHLLFWPQYWAFRLSGIMATEVTSLGCHTDLWVPRAAAPSTLAHDRGWAALLPPLRPARDVLGPVTEAVVAATGLDPAVRVRVGIHDSNASLLPYLAEGPCGVVSTGTWVIAMAIGGAEVDLARTEDTLLNVAADGRAVPSARFMGGRMRDAAIADGAEPEVADRAVAQRTAERLEEIGAVGPVFVEGPFGASEAFLSELRRRTGRAVRSRGDGAGTTMGAALLARDDPTDHARS